MHTRGSKTTGGNCKPRGERSQGRRTKAVVATWHAQRRGRERHCPVAAAKAAVRRNMRELRRACPQRSDRAAIDYCQAIAIVERKSRRQFIVITILKAWMAVAGTPLVIDGQKTSALPVNTAQEIRKRQAEEKVRAALAAHRAAMSAASA